MPNLKYLIIHLFILDFLHTYHPSPITHSPEMPSNNANRKRKEELLKIANGIRNGTIERPQPKPTEEGLAKMEELRLQKKKEAEMAALKKGREREERKKKLENAEQFFKEAEAAGLLKKKTPKFIRTLHMNKSNCVKCST
jgi:hypothetical protein